MSDQNTAQMMRSGLNLIGQALTIYDQDLTLAVANRRLRTLFGLPDHLADPGAKLEADLFTRSEDLAETNRSLAATIATLEETKRDLTEAEARARMTSKMTPAHIAHVDRNQHYTYSNRKLARVIGSHLRSIIGLHASEALGPEAYAQIGPKFEQALLGEPSVIEIDLQDATRRRRVPRSLKPANGNWRRN